MKTTNRKKKPFEAALREIRASNSRGTVLVAAAMVNQLLFGALKYNLVRLSKREEEDLFEGFGPLSTFSAQIKLGFAMGLYGKKLRHDLDTIRTIRNDFAHTIDDIDLTEPEFTPKMQSLYAISDITDRKHRPSSELLAIAVERICTFLILRTAPFNLKPDKHLLDTLKILDFSIFSEVKRRNVASK